MEKKARVHAVISGRVQGVFFRMETKYAAERFGALGWVKNLPDGTVEAVIEGDETNVEALLEWCGEGPPHARVDRVDSKREEYQGEFQRFDVVY